MRVLSAIFRIITCFVYLIILASLLIAAPVVVGYKPVVVLSGSMEPAFPVGSILYYQPTAFENIAVGDAITFRLGEDSLATHRVVGINEEDQSFVTKGDNNPTEDANPVEFENVAGKALPFAIPFAGHLVAHTQNWFAVLGMGAVILIGLLLPSLTKRGESREKKGLQPTNGQAKKGRVARKKSQLSAQEFFKDL